LQRYRQLKVAIVASGLFTEGGDWRSIYFYARSQETQGAKIALINPSGQRGLRQWLAAAWFSPRVIVNGLGTLASWRVLFFCWLRKDIRIYLHETRFILDGFQAGSPIRYRIVRNILRRYPVLCVSRKAEVYYRERFGSGRTHVVHECPGAGDSLKLDPSKIHIAMVGSINKRKGAELFSAVADLASDRHPEWRLHWIGGLATMDPIYRSAKVTWHGWNWTPMNVVDQCQAFFLSSIDDPCPLSAIEAMQAGKRCVAYKDTGIAELIEGVPGCFVFDEYSPEAALAAIERALAAGPADTEAIAARAKERTSLFAFTQSIDDALR
jgi:glycosyltransferase involved in cell wall biosynthesis